MRASEGHRFPMGRACLAGLVTLGLLWGACEACARDAADGRVLYVDVESRGGPASDGNPGTRERPWQSALKAFREARPGDTVLFRGGTYRLPRTVHTSDFAPGTPDAKPITFRGAPGERAVITNLRPIPAAEWQRLEAAPGKVVYAAPAGKGFRVSNVVQDGIPLKRAHSGDANVLADTPPEAIAGPGEWSSSLRECRVYVRARDDLPPGDRVEICDVGGFGASGNLICLTPGDAGPGGWPRLLFENLTFETGFHGILVRTGSVVLRDCVLRKSFGDLLNSSAGRVTVDRCEFHAFGESAIDVTGAGTRAPDEGPAPTTLIRGSRFRDSVLLRSPGQKGVNGVMIKGGAADVVVEGCEFANLEVHYGALTLGGASGGGRAGEGIDLVARNNVFRGVSGPYVVLFAGSRGCRFVNNLVTDARVEDLVRISRAKADDPETGNTAPWVLNNLFFRNGVTGGVVGITAGAATGFRMDHNLVFESGAACRLEGETVVLADLPARGLQAKGVVAEPCFRDAGRFDFRPAPGSPVLGAGVDLGKLVPHDADGRPRPAGQWAIGPFE